jgi:hypothetical protein
MEKLNQIIEQMALDKFKNDTSGQDKRNKFVLDNATLGEFIDYFQNKKTAHGNSWALSYKGYKLGNMQGLMESFCREVLWIRMKDKYMEDVVSSLESKLDVTYKVTIEQI